MEKLSAQLLSLPYSLYNSSSDILMESVDNFSHFREYDIFITHSFTDADIVLGIKRMLEDLNYSVYIDWKNDYEINQNRVDKSTALTVKDRMIRSKSFFYATSVLSSESRWVPWETGFFDGYQGKIAILPLSDTKEDQFEYQGYKNLDIYPYINFGQSGIMYVVDGNNNWQMFNDWVRF